MMAPLDDTLRDARSKKESTSRLRILHLEDNALDADLVRAALEESGIECELTVAGTGEAFLEAIRTREFDLILADYQLPKYSGLEALRESRSHNPECPFIFVTGSIGEVLAVDVLKMGATDYILKNRLATLGPAVSRAVAQLRSRIRLKAAEEELQASEAKYRALVANLPDVLWAADERRTPWYISPNAVRLTGFTADEILEMTGEEWRRRVDPLHAEAVSKAYDALLRGEGSYELEYRFQRKDGSWVWLLDRAVSVSDTNRGRAAHGMFSDVTQRRKLESQLRQAQKMESVGQLAAGIAHEINTPVQYIGDNLRFLQDSMGNYAKALEGYERFRSDTVKGEETGQAEARLAGVLKAADLNYLQEEVPRALQQSLEGIQRVGRILKAMKEFSHPGREQKTLTDLNQSIETTVMVARNEWKYVADLECDLDPNLPKVPCLPGELNQVLLNLIVNAAHAVGDVVKEGEKGRITIRTRKSGDGVVIRVEDTGTGIAEDAKSRIFEPFFTTKEVGKGTGQGLALAHSVVVTRHQGSLTFESQVGKGTTFIIRLPERPAGEPIS